MLLCALFGAAMAADKPPELKASWRTITATDLVQENAFEDIFEALSQARAELKWNLPSGDRVVLSVVGEHSAQVGEDVDAEWLSWVDDAYIDHKVGQTKLRIGNQVVRWGKLESTTLLDVLNPTDLRHGVLSPIEDRRIAIPMLRARRDWGAIGVDAVFIPFFVPARQSFLGSDWSLFPPGLLERTLQSAENWESDALTEGFNQAVVTGLSDALEQADSALMNGLDRTLGQAGTPTALGQGAEAAVRWQWYGPGFDLALQGGSVLEDTTTIIADPTLLQSLSNQAFPTTSELGVLIEGIGDALEFVHPRFFYAGLDASSTLGVFTVRGEAAAFKGRALLTRDMSLSTSDEVGAGLGLDWLTNPNIQATVETSWRHLVNVDESTLLIRNQNEYAISAQVSSNLFRNQLKPQLIAQIDPMRTEAAIILDIAWRYSDHVQFNVGGFLFHSPDDTPSTTEALLTYEGGALGIFDQNDAATARFTYWF